MRSNTLSEMALVELQIGAEETKAGTWEINKYYLKLSSTRRTLNS